MRFEGTRCNRIGNAGPTPAGARLSHEGGHGDLFRLVSSVVHGPRDVRFVSA